MPAGTLSAGGGDASPQEPTWNPFLCTVEVDFVALALWVLAVLTRMYRLGEPRAVVFDEMHYGKYAAMYVKRMFFFDSNPPLGKQLVALAGHLAGFDGQFGFDKIGSAYPDRVPVSALRFVPALFGTLLVPVTYEIALQLKMNVWSAALAGILVLIDNALLTQSRYILMEPILMAFSTFGLFAFLRFRAHQDHPFCFRWWAWLFLAVASLTCSVCVKYCGIYTWVFCFFLCLRDLWSMLADQQRTARALCAEALARIGMWTFVTLALYLGVFSAHFWILNRAGPHDTIMTTHFQASLEGGLKSIIESQPLQVVHGSQITLRHTYGVPCWLHSHPKVYPIRYSDQRGSSHQQQVTCYRFKDVNNWWIVRKPEINHLIAEEPLIPIHHGDVIQLVHGMTHRALNSHDVAAPMSPYQQEVSCYIDYNISMPAQNLWRVEIINRKGTGDNWHTVESQVRLVHVNSSQSLRTSGKQLPEWGFYQDEVVTGREADDPEAVWNVEEHRYTHGKEQKDREKELIFAEMIPLSPTKMNFWAKFLELQLKMLLVNQENVQHHMYSSSPLQWLFSDRGVAYWISSTSNAQVYLLGNVLTWYTGVMCSLICGAVVGIYVLRRRRNHFDLSEADWPKVVFMSLVCVGGYLVNYLPYFLVDHTLFLHHYLPSVIFKFLLIAFVFDLVSGLLRNAPRARIVFHALVLLWLFSAVHVFCQLSVLSYGMKKLTPNEVQLLEWKDSWNLIVHKK